MTLNQRGACFSVWRVTRSFYKLLLENLTRMLDTTHRRILETSMTCLSTPCTLMV